MAPSVAKGADWPAAKACATLNTLTTTRARRAITLILGAADKAPTTNAGRTLVSAQLFFGVLLIALYTGNLASFLTNIPTETPVVAVQNLFDKTSLYFNKNHRVRCACVRAGVQNLYDKTSL